ncbi:MAG: class I SAM-dependent methyltransferase [Planctomycetota bacterium]
MPTAAFAVAATHAHLADRADRLAAELAAPRHTARQPADARLLLRLTPDHLELALGPAPPDDAPPGLTPLVPTITPRAITRADPLAKALGLTRSGTSPPTVIDATAGLLTDAAAMLALGCAVTAVERHPAVHALATDALKRLDPNSNLKSKLANLRLHHADAADLIPALPAHDVVYLDPMFPPRRKGRPAKAMWLLHHLTVPDVTQPQPNDAALLRTALAHAARRVVVKRPRLAPPIGDRTPDLPDPAAQHIGKSHRYDIYPTR